jgi:murein DD-endopeptidase MepM/ murein hydrolase activator NlpD
MAAMIAFRNLTRQVFTGALLLIILAGCNLRAPAPGVTQDLTGEIAATLTAVAPPVLPSASPSPVVALAAAPPSPAATQAPLPTPMPDPLQFTFPTAGAEPVSLWRPPLYPIPWEPSPNDHFYFTRPIAADEVNWPLARYRYGYLFYSEPHSGIDVPAPKGTPILAAGPGTVIWSGYGLYFMRNQDQDPYGIAVAIKHDFGHQGRSLYTIYGHMDESYVYRGQRVEAGDQIGVVGETGKVSGPHLHFEVRVGDNVFSASRNPELWIAPPQGMGLLVGRLQGTNGSKALRVPVSIRSLEGKGNYEVISYAEDTVNSDEYYQENLVLGDLPAGKYLLFINDSVTEIRTEITINPGQVTFFTFRGRQGIAFDLPTPTLPANIPTQPPLLTPGLLPLTPGLLPLTPTIAP